MEISFRQLLIHNYFSRNTFHSEFRKVCFLCIITYSFSLNPKSAARIVTPCIPWRWCFRCTLPLCIATLNFQRKRTAWRSKNRWVLRRLVPLTLAKRSYTMLLWFHAYWFSIFFRGYQFSRHSITELFFPKKKKILDLTSKVLPCWNFTGSSVSSYHKHRGGSWSVLWWVAIHLALCSDGNRIRCRVHWQVLYHSFIRHTNPSSPSSLQAGRASGKLARKRS